MVKAVISGYYGYKNFGDEEILTSLLKHLNELHCEATVLSGDVEYTKEHNNVNAVNRFSLRAVINEIKNCDVLISGGGSLLQDVTSLKSLIYYLFIISLGLLFNKKVIIFAQGIGPINNKFAQFITKILLKFCTYVSVRDEISRNVLEYLDIKADLVCDPIWNIDIAKAEKTNSVGIQLRKFKNLNYKFLQKLALLVSKKFSDKKIEIFSLQEDLDYDISKMFEKYLLQMNPDLVTEVVTENIAQRISQLEYMIGMRFHALLIAIKSGVKTCAINYDIKVKKLAKEANIPMISTNATENYEEMYQQLTNLNSEDLLRYAKSNVFDWTKFDSYFL